MLIVLTLSLVLCASLKVAAMFKIGNSKELPLIPDNMSEEGKDFVRLCLQRNPLHRPTAAQLLEHPFVKNAAPLERPILSADPSDAPPVISNAVRSLVRAFSSLKSL
jgi:serine/threonine protein kinase